MLGLGEDIFFVVGLGQNGLAGIGIQTAIEDAAERGVSTLLAVLLVLLLGVFQFRERTGGVLGGTG